MHRRRPVSLLLLLVTALAAQAEPYKLSVYYQGPAGVAREIERGFEAFRGDVVTIVPFEADTPLQMDAVGAAADIVWGGNEGLHQMLRSTDRLAPYRSSELAAMDTRYWSAEPTNPVSGLEGLVIAYSPARMAAEAAPARWRDLADPKWRGRVALRDPSEALAAAGTMTRKLGWSFFESLAAQRPHIEATDEMALADLESGSALAAIVPYQAVTQARSPLEVVWPSDAPILTQRRVAILKQEKRPGMMSGLAQQLVDYILSGEGQAIGRKYGLFSTRVGAQPPTGAPNPPAEVEASPVDGQPADLHERLKRLFAD